jgi:L-ornithine N5-oxygenase
MTAHDLIGIGFGPSNIALAIALDEKREAGRRMDALFIEKQPGFAWHKDMLLDQAHMQISFLKDLATLRNPTSRFTFVNYLHEKQRLQDFINLKTFFPSRHEFSDYFAWAAAQFANQCAYGEEVLNIQPEKNGREVTMLRVHSRNNRGELQERLTRNLVVSVGGSANIPEVFRPFAEDGRIVHSSRYLQGIKANRHARRIAVVGAGQSAAEIFMDLHGRPGEPQIDLIMRARTIKPSDDSPFVNEIFNVDFVDHIFSRTDDERSAMLREFRHTNYACPDMELIEQIFKVFYQQRIKDECRHRFLRQTDIKAVQVSAEGVRLTLRDGHAGIDSTVQYDAVVLATGYERKLHQAMLDPLAPYLQDFEVDRHYRLKTRPDFKPAIFLQGACEATHGLSDTLLSVTAARTGEIGDALTSVGAQAASQGIHHPRAALQAVRA